MGKIGIKNLISLLAICGGLAYWYASDLLDTHSTDGENACREIRKANERIALLTVSEVVTKDVIYLKQDYSKFRAFLVAAGKQLVIASLPIYIGAWFVNPDLLNYKMNSGTGVVWAHQGIIEYVVDLSQAQVEVEKGLSWKQRPLIQVKVPEPYVDPESLRLNLEKFGPILKNEMFSDGNETMKKMETIAKNGFVNGLHEIASTKEYMQDARVSAKKALMAIYTSVANGADVEVLFLESK